MRVGVLLQGCDIIVFLTPVGVPGMFQWKVCSLVVLLNLYYVRHFPSFNLLIDHFLQISYWLWKLGFFYPPQKYRAHLANRIGPNYSVSGEVSNLTKQHADKSENHADVFKNNLQSNSSTQLKINSPL